MVEIHAQLDEPCPASMAVGASIRGIAAGVVPREARVPLPPLAHVILMAALATLGCARQEAPSQPSLPGAAGRSTTDAPAPPPRSPSASLALPLTDAAPFTAGEVAVTETYARRDYRRGAVRITVTLARTPGGDEQLAEWARLSAGYPAASLDIAPGTGSGFYDCGGAPPTCSLHIQLRVGVHVEVMGNGTASRDDLAELVRRLPLRELASSGG